MYVVGSDCAFLPQLKTEGPAPRAAQRGTARQPPSPPAEAPARRRPCARTHEAHAIARTVRGARLRAP